MDQPGWQEYSRERIHVEQRDGRIELSVITGMTAQGTG